MADHISNRPRVTEPMSPLMTHEDIAKVLGPCRHLVKGSLGCFGRYEPADGLDTHHRRIMYRERRAKDARRALWYKLHHRSIKKIKSEEYAKPIGATQDSEQVSDFVAVYARCRAHGFCTSPWDRARIDEKFESLCGWTIDGVKASDGIRKSWTFENGFNKVYRSEAAWREINFDDEDLPPEETASGIPAAAWLDEYTTRFPPKLTKRARTLPLDAKKPNATPTASRRSSIYSPDLCSQPIQRGHTIRLGLRRLTEQLSRMSLSAKTLDLPLAATAEDGFCDDQNNHSTLIPKIVVKASEPSLRRHENSTLVSRSMSDSAVGNMTGEMLGLKPTELTGATAPTQRIDSALDMQ